MNPLHAFNALHRAEQVAAEVWATAARHGGLGMVSARQIAVLDAVARHVKAHGTPPNQSDIVAATGIDRSTLADLVRRLEERNMVRRMKRRSDARCYDVRLTGGGLRALDASIAVAARADVMLRQRVKGLDGLTVIAGDDLAEAAE